MRLTVWCVQCAGKMTFCKSGGFKSCVKLFSTVGGKSIKEFFRNNMSFISSLPWYNLDQIQNLSSELLVEDWDIVVELGLIEIASDKVQIVLFSELLNSESTAVFARIVGQASFIE
jgi:hypothetical protein